MMTETIHRAEIKAREISIKKSQNKKKKKKQVKFVHDSNKK